MNNHAKRLCKDVESLDFWRDYDAEEKTKARRVYRHSNDPSQAIKVFDQMSDNSITAAVRKANKIAETGWSGPRQPQTIKERATMHRRKERTKRQRDDEARRERAEKAEAEFQVRQKVSQRLKQRREIEDLMRPGYGR